jgi:nitroreductase
MSLTRRTLIQSAGGAGLALAAGALGWRVVRTPTTATAPWSMPSPPPADVRLDAFRHAILAPNPHNRQPWLITLVGDDAALLHCDLDRRLPHTDPFDRQVLIGFGCFVELACIAASARGTRIDVQLFPDGLPSGDRLDAKPIARLVFAREAAVGRDPLLDHVLVRRSVKEVFDTTRPVPADALAALARSQVDGVTALSSGDARLVDAMRKLTWHAWEVERLTPRTWQESVDLMRIGAVEIDANPDGISLQGPMMEGLLLAGQISRDLIAKPGTTAHEGGVTTYRKILETSMAFAWLTTPDNARTAQVAAGRAHMRLHLTATALGLSLHPVSQALQEFPEMAEPYRAVHKTLGVAGDARVQMLLRLGYGPAVSPSPRWPLETRLRRV